MLKEVTSSRIARLSADSATFGMVIRSITSIGQVADTLAPYVARAKLEEAVPVFWGALAARHGSALEHTIVSGSESSRAELGLLLLDILRGALLWDGVTGSAFDLCLDMLFSALLEYRCLDGTRLSLPSYVYTTSEECWHFTTGGLSTSCREL